ncbi:MAG TPA: hypothetical protein VMW66_03890 [Elusimicrobiales bacterium]|nr:hypothetical protein [Elusimicrobiales bacterium]
MTGLFGFKIFFKYLQKNKSKKINVKHFRVKPKINYILPITDKKIPNKYYSEAHYGAR